MRGPIIESIFMPERNTEKFVKAVLLCTRCNRQYPFSFSMFVAGIEHRYKGKDIAKSYIERCAPVTCGRCL